MSNRSHHLSLRHERGIALVTVMLMLLLCSAILAGFLVSTATDVRLRTVDKSRTQAFYSAHAGLEKLTADLGDLFRTDFNPRRDDLEGLEANPPSLTDVAFTADDGLGYKILPELGFDANGNPRSDPAGVVTSGPYEGFTGLKTRYDLTATAVTHDGSEARLTRSFFTIAIPVFQFGVFSENDLSFFAGPDFNFGGRVHTNGNLYLASGATLFLADKVTAFGEIIRTHLNNGRLTSVAHTGAVKPVTAPGAYRALTTSEGSLVNTVGSAQNEPTWTNRSIGTYHGYIRNGRTGAKNLQLPLVTIGGTPMALITRPVPGEDELLTGQRMYSQANVRILLSDTAANITGLPGGSGGVQPIQLDTLATMQVGNGVGGTYDAGGGVNPVIPPALANGRTADTYADPTTGNNVSGAYRWTNNTPLIGGWLKVEYRNAADAWVDVTTEWLNLGFTRRNIESSDCNATEPSPNAIIRFQRVKAVPSPGTAGTNECAGGFDVVGGVNVYRPRDYWPLTLYDTREGKPRDDSTLIYASGVMHYIEFDVNNFRRWLAGTIGNNGNQVVNDDGYTVYFSDRRNNKNAAGNETGEYGDEDRINRNVAAGIPPNGTPDTGEDINDNGTIDTYGQTPVNFPGGYAENVGALPANLPANTYRAPFNAAMRPWTTVTAAEAKANRPLFFRRALKIVNGASGSLPTDGLTIVAENPVYVLGPYNATNAAFADPHAPASIMADAVTLLSPSWNDQVLYAFPNNPAGASAAAGSTPAYTKVRTTTYYRMAIIGGKPKTFPWTGTTCAAACPDDYGTDAGTHNFLRYLESGNTVNYRGSIAMFFFNRQATGVYKCCATVYGAPTRGYNFDVEFLNPALLPPKTPMFRDTNTTGFQILTRRQQ